MAAIALERVEQTLTPWLGEELLRRMPRTLKEAQRRLSMFTMGTDDPAPLAGSLEGLFYSAVRRETEAAFLVTLTDGSRVRMEADDFSVIADELLWLVFEQCPLDARCLMQLRDYAARSGSLSARRALYERCRDYQTNDELKTLRRQIKSGYPAWRWQGWLGQPIE